MMFRPALLGLLFFCVGSMICVGASRLPSGRYPRYVVMTLGVASMAAGLCLAFFGNSLCPSERPVANQEALIAGR